MANAKTKGKKPSVKKKKGAKEKVLRGGGKEPNKHSTGLTS